MSFNEIIDVVSPEDIVIGSKPRSEVYKNKLHFRVVNAFVINNMGQLWIPRRHPNKKLFPLHLDTSVGGHVLSGESYEDAFIRETQEEIGLNLTKTDYIVLDRLTPPKHGTSAFMYVYGIHSNKTPLFNTQDFTECYWLYPEELLSIIDNGEQAKGDLSIIIRAILQKLISYKKI